MGPETAPLPLLKPVPVLVPLAWGGRWLPSAHIPKEWRKKERKKKRENEICGLIECSSVTTNDSSGKQIDT